MPENFALYSQTLSALPDTEMQVLAPGAALATRQAEHGFLYVYRWPDLTITGSLMPPSMMPEHLRGFEGYVRHIYGGQVDARGQRILARLGRTTLVLGIEIEPQRDPQGRAAAVLGKLCHGLAPVVFFWNALLDADGKLLLGADGSFNAEAKVD